ncbi:acyltransferase family protein [Robbsia andropogonis]|uniref:acyltransferase family protein n=1 Tax=Robbsia andropogonis TaxID=28092 RepID=UPI0004676CE2|nr:acyltransferase [Robbsia andropogonis]
MKQKLVGIEILRFLSAFAVLIWHYQHFYFVLPSDEIMATPSEEPFSHLLRPLYDFGWLGVNFFWTISGFVFYSQYLTKVSTREVSGRAFIIRRFSRLYPLHIVTLLIVAALQYVYFHEESHYFVYAYNSLYDFFVNVIFASGWLTPYTDSFNGPVWSVSTELVIYLVFFLAARYLRIEMTGTLFLIVISAAVSIVMVLHRVKGPESNVFFCAFYFFLGGAVHLLVQRMRGLIARRRKEWITICMLIYLALIAFCSTFGATKYLVATVGAPVSIFLLLVIEPYIPRRSAGVIMSLGDTTYASYLIHFPIQLTTVLLLHLCGLDSATTAHNPAFLVIYLAVVFSLAHLVFIGFERPAQRTLRRALGSRPDVPSTHDKQRLP